jgi:hypothetical protein
MDSCRDEGCSSTNGFMPRQGLLLSQCDLLTFSLFHFQESRIKPD